MKKKDINDCIKQYWCDKGVYYKNNGLHENVLS